MSMVYEYYMSLMMSGSLRLYVVDADRLNIADSRFGQI